MNIKLVNNWISRWWWPYLGQNNTILSQSFIAMTSRCFLNNSIFFQFHLRITKWHKYVQTEYSNFHTVLRACFSDQNSINFEVVISNASFPVSRSDFSDNGNFTTCAQSPGTAIADFTSRLTCLPNPVKGRFIFITNLVIGVILCLCEVEINAGKPCVRVVFTEYSETCL